MPIAKYEGAHRNPNGCPQQLVWNPCETALVLEAQMGFWGHAHGPLPFWRCNQIATSNHFLAMDDHIHCQKVLGAFLALHVPFGVGFILEASFLALYVLFGVACQLFGVGF